MQMRIGIYLYDSLKNDIAVVERAPSAIQAIPEPQRDRPRNPWVLSPSLLLQSRCMAVSLHLDLGSHFVSL